MSSRLDGTATNRIFAFITPTLAKVRTLKQTNLGLYKVIKHSVNLTITVIFFAIIYGVIKLVGNFIA